MRGLRLPPIEPTDWRELAEPAVVVPRCHRDVEPDESVRQLADATDRVGQHLVPFIVPEKLDRFLLQAHDLPRELGSDDPAPDAISEPEVERADGCEAPEFLEHEQVEP